MLQIGFFSSSCVFFFFCTPPSSSGCAPLFGRVVDWMTRRLSACRQIFLMIFVQAMLASFDLGAVSVYVCVCVWMCVGEESVFYAPVSAKLIIYIYRKSRVCVKASHSAAHRSWTRFFQLCAAYSDFTVLSLFNHPQHHHHHRHHVYHYGLHNRQSSVTLLDNLCIMCTI